MVTIPVVVIQQCKGYISYTEFSLEEWKTSSGINSADDLSDLVVDRLLEHLDIAEYITETCELPVSNPGL